MGTWTPGPGATTGNDLFEGDSSGEFADGLAGNDTLHGNDGDDSLLGEDGNDTLKGNSGNDTLIDLSGTSTSIKGGSGDDLIVVLADGTMSGTLDGGGGTDVLNLNAATGTNLTAFTLTDIETLYTGGLNITATAAQFFGFTTIETGGGNPTGEVFLTLADSGNLSLQNQLADRAADITASAAGNLIEAGPHADTLHGRAGNDALDGSDGNDTMAGGQGDDLYYVRDAGDVVIENAGEGYDTVVSLVDYTLGANAEDLRMTAGGTGTGNAADNFIWAGYLVPSSDDTKLFGLGGDDRVDGGDGNDTLYGGTGDDSMYGGYGDDIFFVDSAGDVVTEIIYPGLDTVRSSVTFTLPVDVENLVLIGTAAISGTGNDADNSIIGNAANNTLRGEADADTLKGAGGNDSLYGSDGKDTLNGGPGNDSLVGGDGADRIVFNSALNAASNYDIISGFSTGTDTIALDNAIFASIGSNGSLSSAFFHIGSAAADGNDFIINDPATGALYYDADGTGAAAQILFAIAPGLTLTSFDFLVI